MAVTKCQKTWSNVDKKFPYSGDGHGDIYMFMVRFAFLSDFTAFCAAASQPAVTRSTWSCCHRSAWGQVPVSVRQQLCVSSTDMLHTYGRGQTQ